MKGLRDIVMTKEESIAFAENLCRKYKDYEDICRQIEDNKAELKRPVSLEHKPHAAFKFFWPFLIAAAASMTTLYFLALISGRVLQLIFALLALIVPVVLLICGGTHARRLRDELNTKEVNAVRTRKKRIKDLTDLNEELTARSKEMKTELDVYKDTVPMDCRTSAKMERVITLLKSGRAEDFSDALSKL